MGGTPRPPVPCLVLLAGSPQWGRRAKGQREGGLFLRCVPASGGPRPSADGHAPQSPSLHCSLRILVAAPFLSFSNLGVVKAP